jgi:nucleoside-diphosphate-sugar epimerase
MRLIDAGRHRIVTSHVDNTVEALTLALDHGRPGHAYFAFDDDTVTIAEFLGQLMAAHGLTLPAATVPAPAARAMATAMDAVWRLTRRPGDPPITRLLVALNSGPFLVSDQRSRDELGYRPILTRAEGMARLADLLAALPSA